MMKRVCAFGLFLLILLTPSGGLCASAQAAPAEEGAALSSGAGALENYYGFLLEKAGAARPAAAVAAVPKAQENAAGVRYPVSLAGKEDAVLLGQNGAGAFFTVSVAQAGLYSLRLEYLLQMENSLNANFDLYVNGALQHKSMLMLKFPQRFKNASGIRTDARGNDIRPQKTEIRQWCAWAVEDPGADTRDAMLFYLEQGENVLEVRTLLGGVALRDLVVFNEERSKSCEEYLAEHKALPDGAPRDYFFVRQAEDCGETSDSVLYPTYDRSSAATQPNDPVKLRLNTIGQSGWNRPGQWIEWEIEVPKDGFYELGARVRQNQLRGFFSTRAVYVDGEILFDELYAVRFPYRQGWYIQNLGGKEGRLFYLEKGKHTLRMEAALGAVSESIAQLDRLTLEMNTLYRNIIMVTGLTADIYRDYMLEQQIPDLTGRLTDIKDRLSVQMKTLAGLGVKGGSDAVVLEKLIFQIDSFIEKPETIPGRMSSFLENISAMSAWALSMKNQPLEIDYLYVKAPSVPAPKAGAGFFRQLAFRFGALAGSFSEDYSSIAGMSGEDGDGEPLEVWVALGRDQGQVIKDLSENKFTHQTDVSVNISLMQTGLNEAIAAGRGPDIALFAGDVVNLASRGALADLSKYENFGAIAKRFSENAFNPFRFGGGVYALPLEQTAMMLFYRTDIFSELGLKVPDTWEDFDRVLTVLQKNRLSAGLYAGTSTVGDPSVFEILLYQSGGSLFNAGLTQTALDSAECYKAFRKWTDYYTKYSLPAEFNFYNRFRSGEMPVGIQSQGMYATLKLAAPELDGLWEMRPAPQTVLANGTKSDLTISGVSPAIVLKNSRETLCMEYLDWFTGAEIQTEYGREIENVLGLGARYNSANLEAVGRLNWTPDESALLAEQLTKSFVTPAIPASYYIGRNLTNAFRRVVIGGYTARESLLMYNEIINSEIARKNSELARRAGKEAAR